MGNGTTVPIYKKNLHKCNAREQLEEAEEMLTYYRDQLMCMAASGPHTVDEGEGPVPWLFYVRREVDEILSEYEEQVTKRLLAQYVVDWPSECKDDLVESDWPEEEPDGEAG